MDLPTSMPLMYLFLILHKWIGRMLAVLMMFLTVVLCLIKTFRSLHVILVVLVWRVSRNRFYYWFLVLLRRPVNQHILFVSLTGTGLNLWEALVAATMVQLLSGRTILRTHIWIILNLRRRIVLILNETLLIFDEIVILLFILHLRVLRRMMLGSYSYLRLRTVAILQKLRFPIYHRIRRMTLVVVHEHNLWLLLLLLIVY